MGFLAILCSVRVRIDKTTEIGDRVLAWLPESKKEPTANHSQNRKRTWKTGENQNEHSTR
jgi:hypothetical protein